MPSLSPEEQDRMLGGEHNCHACGQRLTKNYCRQCDQFFGVGHAADCPEMDPNRAWSENHEGHRTY